MRFIRGGGFVKGSDLFYPEERPRTERSVRDFWIDRHPVTNLDFQTFVTATGYVTFAERGPREETTKCFGAGSAVFTELASDSGTWWEYRLGAYWRAPLGIGSGIDDLLDHPVVHIAYEDALAYATWVGKALPTEDQWEFAARGGLADSEYAWGDELAPGGKMMANFWQGAFPHENDLTDGWLRTSPVGAFPPNGFDLVDMIGNVWEWTSDWWNVATNHPMRSCCSTDEMLKRLSLDPFDPSTVPRKVIKGGSHLCAPNYCQRYRPAARHPQAVDSPTSHIGFRCVLQS
ncbi:gliding motility-associated lipoprotein GldK [Pseudomonas sp. LB-090624]|nr:formylglycine-generating enzyme family protein [Pseudomonas sp. LB-090624]PYB79619.1 gliding motility-associated lipoprotein GldK [Pseudomonas sp. LB-090624]